MQSVGNDTNSDFVGQTRTWLERVVIGLNLCPFAKAVHVRSQIRFTHSLAENTDQLRQHLVDELNYLRDVDPDETDTTLLIHPFVLTDFFDYNEFLAVADATVEEMGLSGEVQIASFHPDYQFADAAPDDITNCTNRAPYPILHLLRESSVDRAVAAFPEADEIYERNMETMRQLGASGWAALTTYAR